MQFQTFLLAKLFLFVTVASAVTHVPGGNLFRLRATTYKNAVPAFSGYLEVRGDTAGFGWTPDYKGFTSYVKPTPKGELHTQHGGKLAYLFPIHTTPGLYDLRFGRGVPLMIGVLASSFYPTVGMCGGNCGGSTLVYDETPHDDLVTGVWLATKNTNGKGYKVRWWKGSLTKIPKNHYMIYLFRDMPAKNYNKMAKRG